MPKVQRISQSLIEAGRKNINIEVLKSWRSPETGLEITISSVDGKMPKLMFSPYRTYTTKLGREGKLAERGSWTLLDFLWFYGIVDEIKDEWTKAFKHYREIRKKEMEKEK